MTGPRKSDVGDLEEFVVAELSPVEKAKRLIAMLESRGVDIADVFRVSEVKAWQAMHKDGDDQAVVTDLKGITLSPSWAEEPAWPPVQPADPVTVRRSRAKPRSDEVTRWLVYSDPQIAWWRNPDAGLAVSSHDPDAMAAALAVAKHAKPDHQLNVGDFLDLPHAGRFEQHAGWRAGMQADVNTGHRFLALQRATAPWSTIRLHQGNHDLRLAKQIAKNFMASMGLKRADAPEGWPVLSVPNLLALDTLDVEYVDGYPSDRTWVTSTLRVIHGEVSSKHTTSKVVAAEHVSTIQGHIHRREQTWKTVDQGQGEPVEVMAASPGCLCRINGATPSGKTGVDLRTLMPKPRVMDWQQGVAVVDVWPDGSWHYEDVPIRGGVAVWRGDRFLGDPEHVELLDDPTTWRDSEVLQ